MAQRLLDPTPMLRGTRKQGLQALRLLHLGQDDAATADAKQLLDAACERFRNCATSRNVTIAIDAKYGMRLPLRYFSAPLFEFIGDAVTRTTPGARIVLAARPCRGGVICRIIRDR